MIQIIKRIFCKHRFNIVRFRHGFFVFSDMMRCDFCGKKRMPNKKDLQEQLIHPKPIIIDDSMACSYYKNSHNITNTYETERFI